MIAARLAAGQAGLGHAVQMVTYAEHGGEDATRASLADIPHIESVDLCSLPPASRWESTFGGAARRKLTSLVAQVDAVHLHNVWNTIDRVAGVVCRKQRKPYLVLLNGMLDPWSLQQRALKKRLALAMGYRRMLDGAAALHLGNRDEKQLIQPLGLHASAAIIPNGVFLEELDPLPPRDAFHRAHPELKGEPYVLFLSRLHYKKGLNYLAEAFNLLARRNERVRLVVAGPDGGAEAEFRQQIEAGGVASRVHIVGPIYGRVKIEALVGAQCFCLPSHQEGFSLAITEAAGCGVPAVISEGCHFPEIADAGAGFVLPLEPEKFADALELIVTDSALRQRMSLAGRALVEKNFTWPVIAQQTVDAYAAAIRAGGEPI